MRFRIVLLVLALIPAFAHAQRRSDSSVKIVYFHATNHAEVRTLNGDVIQSVASGTTKPLEVRVPQIVGIVVADPNPLFYKYKKGDTTFVTNADYATALEFAKAINPLSGFAGSLESSLIENNTELKTRLQQLKDYAAAMPDIAAQTLGTKENLVRAQTAVDSWELRAIETALNNAGKADDGTSGIKITTSSGTDLSAGITENNFGQADTSANKTKEKQTSSTAATTQQAEIAALNQKVAALEAQILEQKTSRAVEEQERKVLEDAKTTLATLKTFRTAVNAVNQELPFDPETVELEKNPTVHLLIDRLPQFPTVEPGRKTGDISIPLKGYSPVSLAFGPAIVYSFVKAPSFSAEAQTDGKFKIVEKPGENRAQNISAMLNITPRAWSDATFGGSFQLGISPVKDQVGIFTGLQLRISRLATIGGGYGFQQVPRLDRDLTVGGIVDTADALKTSSHFKGGAYVAITVTLPKAAEN